MREFRVKDDTIRIKKEVEELEKRREEMKGSD